MRETGLWNKYVGVQLHQILFQYGQFDLTQMTDTG